MDVQVGMIVAAISEEGDLDEEGNQNWFRARIDRLIDVRPGMNKDIVMKSGTISLTIPKLKLMEEGLVNPH